MRIRYNIIASNAYLASVGKRCGLQRLLAKIKVDNSRANVREQGTTVEATWGAIYLDSGYDYGTVKSAMGKMLATADLLDDGMLGDPAEATPVMSHMLSGPTSTEALRRSVLDGSMTAIASGNGMRDAPATSHEADEPVDIPHSDVHLPRRRNNRRIKTRNLTLKRMLGGEEEVENLARRAGLRQPNQSKL
ncbi:hypothetical protein LTR78_002462 [Recurvomyces mirabilis]|uniref:Uncharacterized protein n=1 Tax=Recurvomyces mirabilis TaxID=574656 RepID=A0AAE0WTH5_9PEZI|nr:hypothetical protein LTR78_002462 [Recurvomyces mirabilis]KAK5157391.1 hypothetical protein LTS14_004156 [Recurvomyces mirabilis]